MPKCRSLVAALMVAGLVVTALPHLALARDKFTLAISIYAGWMPWYYAKDQGIIKKWAERYKIAIDVVEMDYIPSIEAYVAGKVDATVMTNMEALDMPARSGVESTALIVGDYSNGNDAPAQRPLVAHLEVRRHRKFDTIVVPESVLAPEIDGGRSEQHFRHAPFGHGRARGEHVFL